MGAFITLDSKAVAGTTTGIMPETLFATVAIEQPLDRTYTYVVPPRLRGRSAQDSDPLNAGETGIRPGSRVVVPLGRGNRLTQATVLSLSTEPPQQVAAENESPHEGAGEESLFQPGGGEPELHESGLKSIVDLQADVLPVPADLLDLAKWISAYYCAPIGMTLASMVPAAVKRATRLPVNLKVSLAEPPGEVKLSPKSRDAFEKIKAFLQETPTEPRPEHEVLAHAAIGRPALKRFAAQGLLKIEREIKLPEHAPIGADLAPSAGAANGDLELTPDQKTAMQSLEPLLAENAPGFAVRLIHGVTGSGKTELYIRAIERIVARGRRAIVLVPEISLTPQTVRRFTARFPRVAVLHSGLKDAERHQHWHAIATGWAQVIVGARSAIFAPVSNLGLIIVDEEHDPSYKQDSLPKYHGRDVAIRRAQMWNVPVLLGSATPALESWHNAHHHANWGLLSLRSRPMDTQMPRVVTVDMKVEARVRRGLHILSTTLEHHLKQTLEQKKQAIFLLNRRGYAHYLMCPRCDWVLMCDNCDATMVVHRTREPRSGDAASAGGTAGNFARSPARPFADSAKDAVRASLEKRPGQKETPPRVPLKGTVQCHYCLTAMILPETCPHCQARLTHLGQGTQRAEDELLRKFPDLRVKRMDSDSMGNLGEYQRTLDAFGRGELDLLIGTQMIAKGLDFPNVSLVGVLNSDLAMTIPDFRAAERTFQLICQVAGRSGRAMGGARGTVVVQTYQPNEPAIAAACHHDYLGFVRSELPHRKEFGYPPYGRLVRMVLSHKGYTTVQTAAQELVRLIYALTQKLGLPVRVHGPLPPPMERLMEQYRMELVLFSDSALPLQRLLASLRARGALATGSARGNKVAISVDVDPLHML